MAARDPQQNPAQLAGQANLEWQALKILGLWASRNALAHEADIRATPGINKEKFDNLLSLGEYLRMDKDKFLPRMQRLLTQAGVQSGAVGAGGAGAVTNLTFIATIDGRPVSWFNKRSNVTRRLRENFYSRRPLQWAETSTPTHGRFYYRLNNPQVWQYERPLERDPVAEIIFRLGNEGDAWLRPYLNLNNRAFIGSSTDLQNALRVFAWFRTNGGDRDAILQEILNRAGQAPQDFSRNTQDGGKRRSKQTRKRRATKRRRSNRK